MTLWYPPEYPHNLLRGLFGDSPYYHVSENIFQALKSSGGFSPSAANPFATVDLVDSVLATKRQKSAWGRVGSTPYSGSSDHYVDIQTGVASGGYYSGDIGFQNSPSVILAVGQFQATDTDHHGWNTYFHTVTSNGFFVHASVFDLEIGWIHFLCTGD